MEKNVIVLLFFTVVFMFPSCDDDIDYGNVFETLGRLENWEMKFTDIKTTDINDEHELLGGSHDEPALIVFWFKSRFAEPSSTKVGVNTYIRNDHWSPDLANGEQATIHARVGASEFQNIIRWDLLEVLNGNEPEIMGALVIALEHDNTSWGTIEKQVKKMRKELENQLIEYIESNSVTTAISEDVLAQNICSIIRAVNDAAQLSAQEKLFNWITSYGHSDDMIDTQFLAFIAIDDSNVLDLSQDNTDNYQLSTLQHTTYSFNQNPLVFSNDNTKYEIAGFMKKK